jgi:hypothetical protein
MGALYFIRNPLDVAVSYAYHCSIDVDRTIGWMADPEHVMAGAGHLQLRQRLLTWSDHVRSWVDSDVRPHVVRYEDMHADQIATFTGAAAYAGLPTDPDAIERALRFSTFDLVKAQEEEAGFMEKAPAAESFFRRGEVGSWRDVLDDTQVERLVADHGEVMGRFGYLTDDGAPVF